MNAFGPQTPAQRVLESFNALGIPPEVDGELRGSLTQEEIKPKTSSIMQWLEKVPEFKPWPQKLLEGVATDLWDAIKFSGQVLEGKADPRDPENFKQVMNMTLLAIGTGWKPVKAAYPGITDEQIKALDAYTGSVYHQLNRYLEGRLPYEISSSQKKFLEQTADRLDQLIKNSPRVEKDTQVWRGIPGQSFVDRYPNLDPGDVVRFDAFTSTSFKQEIARGFAGDAQTGIVFKINVPKNAPAIHVEDAYRRIGVEGGGFEAEMLLPRSTQFVVKELNKDSRVITLEMVPPGKKVKGEVVEAKPPKPQEPQTPYMQDVTKLLKDLEKSPNYVKNPNDYSIHEFVNTPPATYQHLTPGGKAYVDEIRNGGMGSATQAMFDKLPIWEKELLQSGALSDYINKTPSGFTSSIAQMSNFDQALKKAGKSESHPLAQQYLHEVDVNGYSASFDSYLKATGNFDKFYGKSPVSATPTLETLQAQKSEIFKEANKYSPTNDKWWKAMDKIEALDKQIKVLKEKGKKEFEKLLSEGNAL